MLGLILQDSSFIHIYEFTLTEGSAFVFRFHVLYAVKVVNLVIEEWFCLRSYLAALIVFCAKKDKSLVTKVCGSYEHYFNLHVYCGWSYPSPGWL